eukprot:1360088-Amorphochlora_amoeboformis.AAC.1
MGKCRRITQLKSLILANKSEKKEDYGIQWWKKEVQTTRRARRGVKIAKVRSVPGGMERNRTKLGFAR